MRFLLPVCLLGTLLASAPVSAQHHLTDGPTDRVAAVAGAVVETMSLQPFAPASHAVATPPASTASRMPVDCTDGQALEQLAATSAGASETGGQELGQSFTAPCSGVLTTVSPVINRSVNGNDATVWEATLRVYNGASTDPADQLAATPISFDNATGPGAAFFLNLPAGSVPIVEGQVYTWFLDMTLNDTGVQFTNGSTGDVYTGGDLFFTADGDPANATPLADLDFQFAATFGAPPIETTINSNGVHYRSPPLAGITVDDLAGINLVRGITGYAAGAPNLFTSYDGSAWAAPADGTETLELGRAFRWSLRDGDNDFGSGSVLRPFPTTFFVSQAAANTAAVTLDLETDGDGFNYFGNPFGVPLDVSGIANWSGGDKVGNVFSWDDATLTFVEDADDTIEPWQAFFVKTRPGRSGTLTIPAAAAVGSLAWEEAQRARSLRAETTDAGSSAKTGAAGYALALASPFPNPTRGEARVPFSLAEAGAVRLTATDALGRQVAVLAEGGFSEGAHTATLDTRGLSAGVYVLRLEAGGQVLTQRATVVR